MMNIQDLITVDDSMVFCGEELSYGENVWKMYGFLRQFVKPMWPVTDEMETSHVAYIVDDMILNLNNVLSEHKHRIEYSGGNIYVLEAPAG